MRTIVNTMTAFHMTYDEVCWSISWAQLNWMLLEYNDMHTKDAVDEDKERLKKLMGTL